MWLNLCLSRNVEQDTMWLLLFPLKEMKKEECSNAPCSKIFINNWKNISYVRISEILITILYILIVGTEILKIYILKCPSFVLIICIIYIDNDTKITKSSGLYCILHRYPWMDICAKGLISCQQKQRKIVQFELFTLSYVNQCNYKAINSHR